MNNRIVRFFNILLLLWYLIAPLFWLQDGTLSFDMKVNYSIVNYIIDILLLRVVIFGYKTPLFMDYLVCPLMIVWFSYSTVRDYTESGYSMFFKSLYVSIDVASLLFVIDTFITFTLNSKVANDIFDENVKKIGKYLRALGLVCGSIFCFNLLRGAK